MTLVDRLHKLQTSVDALTLRERLILFVGVLVVIGSLWQALLQSPLQRREEAASDQVAVAQDRLEQLNEAMALAAQGIGDGMPAHLDRLRVLEQEVASSAETIRVFTSDLVDPNQMREVLEGLIERQRGLRLIRAENLEVRPLIEPESSPSQGEEPTLYRHGIVLELEGTYLDCLTYLESVERLPWRLYWGSLQLSTIEYPRNAITLEIFTLSIDEEWIGV